MSASSRNLLTTNKKYVSIYEGPKNKPETEWEEKTTRWVWIDMVYILILLNSLKNIFF